MVINKHTFLKITITDNISDKLLAKVNFRDGTASPEHSSLTLGRQILLYIANLSILLVSAVVKSGHIKT